MSFAWMRQGLRLAGWLGWAAVAGAADTLPAAATPDNTTRITAERISGMNEVEMVAEGAVELQRGDSHLTADRLIYRQADDEIEASGDVHLSAPDSRLTGPHLRLRMNESTGEFTTPTYAIGSRREKRSDATVYKPGVSVLGPDGQVLLPPLLPPAVGSGTADRLEFRGHDNYRLENATYSTCAPGQRDWEMSVDVLDLDYTIEVGTARHAVVSFKDVPFFYLPWMSFPLNDKKKSGFLPATIGTTSKSGVEIALPWYWNIAPDLDATITPRLMAKRGTHWSTELRYLDWDYRGQTRLEYLPDDQVANRDRWGYAIAHSHNLGGGFTAALNYNGVSDSQYFSDLSTRIGQVSQANLLRQGVVGYAGPWYGGALNVQAYQTLQGEVPYRRLPQLTAFADRHDLPLGLALRVNAEYVDFNHPDKLLGQRATLYPQLSLPIATPAFWLTPKVGYHATQYQLAGQERPAAAAWAGVPEQQTRNVPIYSLDGGFVLERNAEWFGGRTLLQTLEPRLYYLYVPTRQQSSIPVFDTALAGLSYAQLFAENRYAGGDRIGDANQLTGAVTSRLVDPASGAEILRATLGQLYYFTPQEVTLPGEATRVDRKTDILAALSGPLLPHTRIDLAWQYNPHDKRTERQVLSARYQPAYGKVFNASYRYTRELLEQIDLSAQWPVFGGWHGVGRYNYSLRERRVIETIAGFEYDAGCWIGRVVVQQLATIASQPTTAFFFQLELKDFSRIGSNPMDLLKRSIPGYGMINQPTADPIFGAD